MFARLNRICEDEAGVIWLFHRDSMLSKASLHIEDIDA